MGIRPLTDFGIVPKGLEYYFTSVGGTSIELVKGNGIVRIALVDTRGIVLEGLENIVNEIFRILSPVTASIDVLYEGDSLIERIQQNGWSGSLEFLKGRKVYSIIIDIRGVCGDIDIGDLKRLYEAGMILGNL